LVGIQGRKIVSLTPRSKGGAETELLPGRTTSVPLRADGFCFQRKSGLVLSLHSAMLRHLEIEFIPLGVPAFCAVHHHSADGSRGDDEFL
jgi:hypothetical protein